jgi:hypothetical protein
VRAGCNDRSSQQVCKAITLVALPVYPDLDNVRECGCFTKKRTLFTLKYFKIIYKQNYELVTKFNLCLSHN